MRLSPVAWGEKFLCPQLRAKAAKDAAAAAVAAAAPKPVQRALTAAERQEEEDIDIVFKFGLQRFGDQQDTEGAGPTGQQGTRRDGWGGQSEAGTGECPAMGATL
eukprot:2582255-Rhodomonas_salina.2